MGSLRMILVCVGLLFVVFGTVAAAFVGPDDTIMIGEKQVPERVKGAAVRTHPEITEFVNIDLLVRASAEGGVFLGASHRVDTESMLSGKRYFEVTRLAIGNVGGVVTNGPRATRKALRPAKLVGWKQQTTGEESAELVVELDGRPVDVIAVPQRGNARVTVAIGAHVAGAFLTQVAVAVVGVLLILASWGWGRLAQRRGTRGKHAGDSGAAATAPSGLPKYPDEARTSGPGLRLVPDRVEVPEVVLASATAPVVATAERVVDLSAPVVDGGPARALRGVPLPRRSVDAVLPPVEPVPEPEPVVPTETAWDLRKIVVVMVLLPFVLTACAVPGPSEKADGDEAVTRTGMTLREAREVMPDATVAYAPEFAAYPMWTLVGTEEPQRLRVMSRASFTSRWQGEARVRVRGDLPATVSRAIPANVILQKRADEYADLIGDFWSRGFTGGLDLDRRTTRARAELLDSGVAASAIWVMPPIDVPRVRLVEVSGGHLVVVRHVVLTPAPHRLTTIVEFPSAARPRVLGSSLVAVD